MNPKNYCTLEYAQKLVDAGIVLETDFVWFHFKGGWQIIKGDGSHLSNDCIPAPQFQDVWDELPEGSYLRKYRDEAGIIKTAASILDAQVDFVNDNLTNAAIALLIWVKEK